MQNKITNNHTPLKNMEIKHILSFFLFSFLLITTNIKANSGDDEIFKNGFDPIFAPIVFLVPDINHVFDMDLIEAKVRVDLGQGALQSVLINNIEATIVTQNSEYAEFQAMITLEQGENTLLAVATYEDQTINAEIITRYIPLNQIIITSPMDWETLGGIGGAGGSTNQTGLVQRPVTITGTLSSSTIVDVQINQQQANFDSSTFTFEGFFLHEGSNFISVVAIDEYDRQSNAQITVYVDQSAPFISVDTLENHITSANQIDITGTVNDAIQADFNASVVTVSINNTTTGIVSVAQVEGINYLASNLPLAVGRNTFIITANDAFGNSRDITAQVTRLAVGSKRLTQYTGNNQQGVINTLLTKPLIINAIDKEGLPLVDLPIYFDVVKGTGTISSQSDSQSSNDGVNPARNLIINTNENGQSQIWLTLGLQAGLANHTIRVYSPQIAEDVYFHATALTSDPAQILIEGASGTQFAQTSGQPVEALTVEVQDIHNNPITNTEVTFRIINGDAFFIDSSALSGIVFEDGQVITTTTDKQGQASVRPYIGVNASNILITAQTIHGASIISGPRFNIIVLQRQNQATSLNGVVMDHVGIPIEGIQFSIARTNLTALSDSDGFFEFPSQVPTGKIDLFVDGRNVQVQQNGKTIEYPALHFETAIIQGQHNQLPHPVYLPPVHIENTKIVGGNQDETIAIPNFQGFKMIVKANSVTFPDGSTVGELVVNPVHNDRLPMVPPGTGGRFIATGWTLQPTGTRFDPPIEVHIPNTDGLKPGTIVPVVQWDHDMAFFVPMGLATVNEDASEIITNPGSGITKAGWGGSPTRFRPPEDSDNGDSGSGPSCRGGSCGCYLPSCGCTPTILANDEEGVLWLLDEDGGSDVEFKVDFSGCGDNDWTYDWRFYDGLNLSQYIAEPSSDPISNVHYEQTNGEPYLVTVGLNCIGCNSVANLLSTSVVVAQPKFVIKQDEENPFELIDRGGPGVSYFETTNLIIEAQYPSIHPKSNQVFADFNGTVRISEDENTNYYDDAFTTYLPVEIEFENGKVEKSLNSASFVSHPRILQPISAKIEIEVLGIENPSLDSIMTVNIEQWVYESDLLFNGRNDPLIPDWFEKAIWTIIEQFGTNPDSEIASEVILGINGIAAATERIEIELTCAYVNSTNYLMLNFKTSCHNFRDIFRLNYNKNLEKIVMHESRHVWQNIQIRLEPEGVIRIGEEEFVNDSDGDYCPEIVASGSEAGLSDSTPTQDGTGNTEGLNPDSVPDNYRTQETSIECFNLREYDATEFGEGHG